MANPYHPNSTVVGKIYNAAGNGLGNSAAYQVAGKPYLTGSTIGPGEVATISFSGVTRSFTLINTGSVGSPLYMYFDNPKAGSDFTEAETHLHRITLDPGDSLTMNVKCSEVYVRADAGSSGEYGFECAAEITHIPRTDMYALTGSGINVPKYSDGIN